MKPCTRCKLEKELCLFNKHKNFPGGYQYWCKACEASYRKENAKHRREVAKHWEARNPIRAKAMQKAKTVKYRYGLSQEQLEDLYAQQESKCWICQKPDDGLHIDHCHATGVVRGLLCRLCNYGLGNFRDSIALLSRAVEYLNKKRKKEGDQ